MKQQAVIPQNKQVKPAQMQGLLPYAAEHATPEHEKFLNDLSESRLGHDFSQVAIHPSVLPVSQHFQNISSLPRIQTKLKIGRSDDKYEQEADRVAEQVMRMPEPPLPASASNSALSNTTNPDEGAIRRVCASCSAEYKAAEADGPVESTNLCPKCSIRENELVQTKQIDSLVQRQEDPEEEEEELLQRQEDPEEEEEELLQPKTAEGATPEVTPEISSGIQSLQGGGRPLSGSERHFFEPRFGADFSSVRLHSDARAAGLARSVNARAFTLGKDVVFGAGEYSADGLAGRQLLAHELTHVVQQGKTESHNTAKPEHIRRRNIFQEFAGLFAGDDFDEQTLQNYLSLLRRTHRIEDHTDSDNKARAVVTAWHTGESPYVLTHDLKALLIKEMLSGFTGDDDERAILELLERSYNYELSNIFGTAGITVDALNSAFQTDEQACLSDFFTRRFQGGEAALVAGTIEPRGVPVAFGDEVPTRCAYNVRFPGLGVEWSEPCVLGILCSEDRQVVQDLTRFEVQEVSRIEVDRWEYQPSSWSITETRTPSGAADAQATPPEIKILSGRTCGQTARVIVHEVRHQNQSAGSRFQRERDAYTYTEEWAIDRGLPGYGNRFRATDPVTGTQTVDQSAVDAYVRARYPGTGSPTETIVGHRGGDSHTEISPVSGSNFFRPPQAGDSHWGDARFFGARTIPASTWTCPGPRPASAPALPPGVIRSDFNDRIIDSVTDL